eukprot:NODE_11814_length_1263_cov_16.052817.p1 GENE.NODE_11814_length_1263_cov_16.052817~~NODE_11814_length_1263_cov_16.052817.p1  ORF type:complete len:407 (+),score=91.59 NODE_11814_length_1263_cov_16.052817:147-1223(+)
MAPELLVRRKCLPAVSADVFSFGRMIYHVTTSQQPLGTLSTAAITNWARTRGRVPPLQWPGSSAFYNEAVLLCEDTLHFEPTERLGIVAVHSRLLAWRPLGLLASISLDAASGPGFNDAVKQARAKIAHERSKPCRTVTGPVLSNIASGSGGGDGIGGIGTGHDADAAKGGGCAGGVHGRDNVSRGPAAGGSGDNCGDGGGSGSVCGSGSGGGSAGVCGAGGRSGGSGSGTPALLPLLPKFAVTPDMAKDVVMVDALTTWNCLVPAELADACCMFHALVSQELPALQARLARVACQPDFSPVDGWQCPWCLLMDDPEPDESTLMCRTCGYTVRRSGCTRGGVLPVLSEELPGSETPCE